jgi:hypothetical protein
MSPPCAGDLEKLIMCDLRESHSQVFHVRLFSFSGRLLDSWQHVFYEVSTPVWMNVTRSKLQGAIIAATNSSTERVMDDRPIELDQWDEQAAQPIIVGRI